MDRAGPQTELLQGIDLVLHEGDEGRDDDPDAVPAQGRNLVTERFPTTGRHEHKSVAPCDDMVDDFRLSIAEAVVAVNFQKNSQRGIRDVSHGLFFIERKSGCHNSG
jgi:hypothetical protein